MVRASDPSSENLFGARVVGKTTSGAPSALGCCLQAKNAGAAERRSARDSGGLDAAPILVGGCRHADCPCACARRRDRCESPTDDRRPPGQSSWTACAESLLADAAARASRSGALTKA